jgi:hypothetical protein
MARTLKLKVFGWTGYNRTDKFIEHQLRCICAATSKAEIMRTFDLKKADLRNICPTGNETEITTAMAEPLVIFAMGLNESLRNKGGFVEYRRPESI